MSLFDDIEKAIKSNCPAEWYRSASSTLTWQLKLERQRQAVIHGGPYSKDQSGNIVRAFKSAQWEAYVANPGTVVLHEMAETPGEAAKLIADHLGIEPESLVDESCDECSGTGEVRLLRFVYPCSKCGGDGE